MENLEYLEKKGYSLKKNKNLDALPLFFNSEELDLLSKRSIAIVGTNGKTSTASLIFAYIKYFKKDVVKFISPHLVQVNERIETNTGFIKDKELSKYIEEVRFFEEKEKLVLGYFESIFLISCRYFLDLDSDFFVVEAGIGGRLDTTSIINSENVVLTNIGYDHTDILGGSLKEILEEKIHISYKVKNFFVGDYSVHNEYEKFIKEDLGLDDSNYHLSDYLEPTRENLKDSDGVGAPDFRNSNLKLARGVMKEKFGNTAGFSEFIVPIIDGRLDFCFSEFPDQTNLKVIDGAHNSSAINALFSALESIEQDNFPKKIECFLGIKKGKDYKKIVEALVEDVFDGKVRDYLTISLIEGGTFQEQMDPVTIAEYLTDLGADYRYASIKDFHSCKEPSILLGSLYLVGEYIKEFR